MDNNDFKKHIPNSEKRERTSLREPIAIIGIGCKFPGANEPNSFWRLITQGVDAISEVPPDRFDIDFFYHPTPGASGKLSTRYGGFVDDVDKFDPYFFGISPREALGMDPQQRLLLEVAWQALEDAGQIPEKLVGSNTGVFVGCTTTDYVHLLHDPAEIDIYFAGGNAVSILSGRLSFIFGFQGASISLDTACSTSLVAVHLACQSIWNGESNMALAGGANLILRPEPSFSFSTAGMLAHNGRCKFGDSSADGFIRSDGIGILVLKPLSKAQADRDPIYAVIRGTAVNNDGRSGGFLMQPSPIGQEEVLWEAYRNAGVSPGDVQYVEAHGTGTNVGDPIELKALGKVFGTGRPKERPLIIGSVKTNIGHTEGASGIAGLIKVALSIKNRTIPPSLHFNNPNPNIPWNELPLVIQKELTPWPDYSMPAIAGVSSFGISGTNAHVILEQAPPLNSVDIEDQEIKDNGAFLFTLSAHTEESLEAMARSYEEFLSPDGKGSDYPLRDICYTASARRTHHLFRLALVARSKEELSEHLEAYLKGEQRRGLACGQKSPDNRNKIVFVCSPTGSQWLGMGKELYEKEPVFRTSIEECDHLFNKSVDWSLIEQLNADDENSRLDEVDIMQPIIFAMQVALSKLWQSWGIKPDTIVGHSMGEVAAAHIAGILTLDDAVRIICLRSRLVRQKASGKGKMAVIEMPVEDVEKIIADYDKRIYLASCNGPTTTVVSGESNALEELKAALDSREIFCQMVKVDYASHSPQMDVLQSDLIESLRGIQPQPASLRMISTATLQILEGPECDELYWMRNIREPVYLLQAVNRLLEEGHNIFLEISPHPILSVAITQTFLKSGKKGTVLPSLRRGEEERTMMLHSLGIMHTAGIRVDWNRLYPTYSQCVPLPPYIWQRERFWITDIEKSDGPTRPYSYYAKSLNGHPVLRERIRLAGNSGTHIWQMELGTRSLPYLRDHRVQGTPVFPAAAYMEMALTAAREVYGEGAHVIANVNFNKVLVLPEDGNKIVQLILSNSTPGRASFELYSLQYEKDNQLSSSTLHATGEISLGKSGMDSYAQQHEPPDRIRRRCENEITGEQHYKIMDLCNIQYGPSFRGVDHIWGQLGESIGRLKIPEPVKLKFNSYRLHPALLDASLQVVTGAQPLEGDSIPDLFLPVGMDSMRVLDFPGADSTLWSHFVQRQSEEKNGNSIKGDIYLLDETGKVLLEVLGIRAQRLDSNAAKEENVNLDEWLYEVQWLPKPLEGNGKPSPVNSDQSSQGTWLIFADDSGVGSWLANKLVAMEEKCILAFRGRDFKRRYKRGRREYYNINPSEPKDMQRLVEIAFGDDKPPFRGVVHLWSLDAPIPTESTVESLEATQEVGCFSLLYLAQAMPEPNSNKLPRLWVITNGLQNVGNTESISVAQSTTWGLARVISMEMQSLRCTNIDLSSSVSTSERKSLLRELFVEELEDQIALRGKKRYIARLARWLAEKTEEKRLVSVREESFRLEVPRLGILDNFNLRETRRKDPDPDEVEIQIYASALNFRDIMIAMNLLPSTFGGDPEFGYECAGKITRIGERVKGFQVGDEVMAGARATIGSFTTADARAAVVHKPAHLSFEEAATIPIAFLTAYYSLCAIGNLQKGERVLIHAASGGVGLAAIQLAQNIGAEIFATAGTPEKREFLKSLGVKHIMDSRSLKFADEIMEITNGEGVDVVLNSLAGEFIYKSLSTLRPWGRFLEIGKVDFLKNSQLGLRLLEENISFHAIDLSQLLIKRTDYCNRLLNQVRAFFDDGDLKPLPSTVFPISKTVDAFRFMAQAKHIGKIVISNQENEVWVAPPSNEPISFRGDASYLISGGLGGIGLKLAEWMIERGAKHLVLMGRSGASSEEAVNALDSFKNLGINVKVAKADVSNEKQVAKIIGEIKQKMPPLKGIIHAAGLLADGLIAQQDKERFRSVLAPKAYGAWILHNLTLTEDLDFFILFSSGSSLLMSPGQANYVAANAFLDSFAHYRRALGLPALTLNWGLWSEVGMATLPAIQKRLNRIGILPFTTKQGLELLERSMQKNLIQVMPSYMDWSKMLSYIPTSMGTPPFFALFEEEANQSDSKDKSEKGGSMREAILAAPPEEHLEILVSFVQELIAKVLGIPPSRLDRQKSLMNTGLDSLMALELKNRIESSLSVDLPVTNLLKGPNIEELATDLLNLLAGDSSENNVIEKDIELISEMLEHVEQLSEEEVATKLAE